MINFIAMKHAVFTTPGGVVNFFKGNTSRKMQGIAIDNKGNFHVFYTESYLYYNPEDDYGEEDE